METIYKGELENYFLPAGTNYKEIAVREGKSWKFYGYLEVEKKSNKITISEFYVESYVKEKNKDYFLGKTLNEILLQFKIDKEFKSKKLLNTKTTKTWLKKYIESFFNLKYKMKRIKDNRIRIFVEEEGA